MTNWVVAGQFFWGLVVILFLFWPYIRLVARPVKIRSEQTWESDPSSSARQVLADLEYDYATEKLSEKDYQHIRRKILAESGEDLLRSSAAEHERNDEIPEDQDALEQAVREAREILSD